MHKPVKLLQCGILAMILVLCMTMSACSGTKSAPALSEVYDEFVALIEASHQLNVVLYGHGLPVYEYKSALATHNSMYVFDYYGEREYVSPYAKFVSEQSIRDAAGKVYSARYTESVMGMMFVGATLGEDTGTAIAARYSQDESWFYQNRLYEPVVTNMRVYDYASMKIVKPSSQNYVNVEIDSYAPGQGWMTFTLSFIHEEIDDSGTRAWRLDSPTY